MKIPEESKFKIYIDTAQRNEKSVSLVRVINGIEEKLDIVSGDIDINSSLKYVLQKNNLRLEDISEFVPNLGPGSFTGLKIGVTIANLLNTALGRKKMSDMYLPEYGGEPNISKKKDPK